MLLNSIFFKKQIAWGSLSTWGVSLFSLFYPWRRLPPHEGQVHAGLVFSSILGSLSVLGVLFSLHRILFAIRKRRQLPCLLCPWTFSQVAEPDRNSSESNTLMSWPWLGDLLHVTYAVKWSVSFLHEARSVAEGISHTQYVATPRATCRARGGFIKYWSRDRTCWVGQEVTDIPGNESREKEDKAALKGCSLRDWDGFMWPVWRWISGGQIREVGRSQWNRLWRWLLNCLREVGKGAVKRPDSDRGQLREAEQVRNEDWEIHEQLPATLKTFYVPRDVHLTPSTQNLPRRWGLLDTALNTQHPESFKGDGCITIFYFTIKKKRETRTNLWR